MISHATITLTQEQAGWIHILPRGSFVASDGRRFQVADPDEIVRASKSRASKFVVDYEHQTDHAEKNGQPAPAAGWLTALDVRHDGIWGRVEWTERAAAMLRAREYRFLSPTFTHTGGKVRVLLRAALTNNPALELVALASAGFDHGILTTEDKAITQIFRVSLDDMAETRLTERKE